MSTLAEIPQGVPFPDTEIRSAIEAAAISGFTGTMQLSIGLREEASECVVVNVLWKESHLEGKPTEIRLPDPTRKKPVDKVMKDLSGKLFIRTIVKAVELRFLKGVLQPHWTHDE